MPPSRKPILDGEVADLWRSFQVDVWSPGFNDWVRRSDRFPYGVDCSPGEDPHFVRARVAKELGYTPAAIRFTDPHA